MIKGARGILQGTSDLLLAFDQGEVRKLVKQVRAVLDYVGLADQVWFFLINFDWPNGSVF